MIIFFSLLDGAVFEVFNYDKAEPLKKEFFRIILQLD